MQKKGNRELQMPGHSGGKYRNQFYHSNQLFIFLFIGSQYDNFNRKDEKKPKAPKLSKEKEL